MFTLFRIQSQSNRGLEATLIIIWESYPDTDAKCEVQRIQDLPK